MQLSVLKKSSRNVFARISALRLPNLPYEPNVIEGSILCIKRKDHIRN